MEREHSTSQSPGPEQSSGEMDLSRRRFMQVAAAAGGGLVLEFQPALGGWPRRSRWRGGFRAERLHPHRNRWADRAGHAVCRNGSGDLHLHPDADRRRAGSRPRSRCDWNMLRLTQSSTAIPCSPGCRQRGARPRYARRGNRCVRQARPRGPCSSRRRQCAGMSTHRPATPNAAQCGIPRRGVAWTMANWRPKPPACRFPKTSRSSDRKISGSSARRQSVWTRLRRSTERPIYGIDARPPGVKIATLAQSPVFGGRVKSVDDAAARAVKGVRQIVRLDDAVAVVADHMGAAKKGLEALMIEWDDGSARQAQHGNDIDAELEKATLESGPVAQNIGDM